MFRNDYSVIAAKEVLEALKKYNGKEFVGYGEDEHCLNAEKKILDAFKVKGQVHFLEGGTQTNLIGISYFLNNADAVICCNTGHINTHEAGAVERSGIKLIALPNHDGKLVANEVENVFLELNEHTVRPKMVYISNSTENGSVYTLKELKELRKVCDKHNLYFFIDGARIGAALTVENSDVTKEDIGKLADIFYVGGTKNGALFGEALVVKPNVDREDFRRHIKSKGGMLAKGYVLGIQFEALFTNNLYFKLAKRGNDNAKAIRNSFINKGYEIVGSSPTNQIFVRMKKDLAKKYVEKFGCEIFGEEKEHLIIRFVTNFATSKKDIDELIKYIK